MRNSLYTGCVGGGTYVNISVAGGCDSWRWTQSRHTHVKNQAIALDPPATIHHSRILRLRLSLSLLHVFFTICLSTGFFLQWQICLSGAG